MIKDKRSSLQIAEKIVKIVLQETQQQGLLTLETSYHNKKIHDKIPKLIKLVSKQVDKLTKT